MFHTLCELQHPATLNSEVILCEFIDPPLLSTQRNWQETGQELIEICLEFFSNPRAVSSWIEEKDTWSCIASDDFQSPLALIGVSLWAD